MRKLFFYLFVVFILFSCCFQVEAGYRPVISGNYESGNRLYTDLYQEDNEEMIDEYNYNLLWLKYKKKITSSEYYYFKIQYYKKKYLISDTYNNIGLDLWGNYTYQITDKLRSRWKGNIKDKNYYSKSEKSYQSYRLKYELDYDYNQKNDYNFYIQRQWNDFIQLDDKDYIRDKIKVEWEHEYTENIKIMTDFKYERQVYDISSDSSNKYGKQFSIGFKYKL